MKFTARGNEIFVKQPNAPEQRTLVVVGGSGFLKGLASEIAEVLNNHYSTK